MIEPIRTVRCPICDITYDMDEEMEMQSHMAGQHPEVVRTHGANYIRKQQAPLQAIVTLENGDVYLYVFNRALTLEEVKNFDPSCNSVFTTEEEIIQANKRCREIVSKINKTII